MYSENTYTQLTFHYRDGSSEAFNVYAPIESDGTLQTLQLEVRNLFKKDWWILNLPEQSVFINLDNVIKIEVKPPVDRLQGDDVFANAERVTALNRAKV
jgi:hypothetical protein